MDFKPRTPRPIDQWRFELTKALAQAYAGTHKMPSKVALQEYCFSIVAQAHELATLLETYTEGSVPHEPTKDPWEPAE